MSQSPQTANKNEQEISKNTLYANVYRKLVHQMAISQDRYL